MREEERLKRKDQEIVLLNGRSPRRQTQRQREILAGYEAIIRQNNANTQLGPLTAEAAEAARDAPCEADHAPSGSVEIDATDTADIADGDVILGVEEVPAMDIIAVLSYIIDHYAIRQNNWSFTAQVFSALSTFSALSIAYHNHHDLGFSIMEVVTRLVLMTLKVLDIGSVLAILAVSLPFLRVTATSHYHLSPSLWYFFDDHGGNWCFASGGSPRALPADPSGTLWGSPGGSPTVFPLDALRTPCREPPAEGSSLRSNIYTKSNQLACFAVPSPYGEGSGIIIQEIRYLDTYNLPR
ncbi:uncharacterized protein NECHADRAFT_89390 [Fusarium vanettenii 77-13-4]|uniref:Uncharacterized protein n=1 Tax=Fusarium vanettenii (strain ATCC MYA-4622 / CBS 123669 / FGSC 9596 / NRRL 45880 / 77-13-4) TaxID=660122 RepID=C7ZR27_FUSV7|nr:uncharacterized protein NECHADRAFT_89390 [Fusarium vanettenii 77-13-4]EEU33530.1 predicted protein [Fusarium vanettenii 77-13-4]